MNRRHRLVLFCGLTAIFSWLHGNGAWALDDSSKPTGDNHKTAQSLADGAGISIGVIENGPAVNAGHNLGTRLKGQWSFLGKKPGEAPVDGSGGAADSHLTRVIDIAAGDNATFPGVAIKADVYTANRDGTNIGAGTHAAGDGDQAGFDATFNSYRAAVDFMHTPRGPLTNPAFQRHPQISILNNSWGAFFETNDNGDNRFARFVDHYAWTRDVLFVGAAGNSGATPAEQRINWPWDAFNGITVGSLEQTGTAYHTRRVTSEYWLSGDDGTAPDRRGKPDIVAPGVAISDGVVGSDSGTSFATPAVTGTAALIAQRAGFTFDPTTDKGHHLAVKSIILNSARKRGIGGPNAANAFANDNNATKGEKSDANYLNGTDTALAPGSTATAAAADRTEKWTPSSWSNASGVFTATLPLDDELGTGALDSVRAIRQFEGGRRVAGNVPRIGWNLDNRFSTSFVPETSYTINQVIPKGKFITITLAWDRLATEVNGGGVGAMLGQVDETDTYDVALGMANMDLFLKYKGNIVAASISEVDNVEHLHVPAPFTGLAGDYEILIRLTQRVILPMNPAPALVSASTSYGLAWQAVPEPGAWGLMIVGGL